MYHHDNTRSYKEAASEAAKEMRSKLETLINQGRITGVPAMERIMAEAPRDKIAKGSSMRFAGTDNGMVVRYGDIAEERLHSFAFGQMTDHVHMPRAYAQYLQSQGAWGNELAAENMTRLFDHDEGKYLIRSVGNQTRGFLSTKYRRLDQGMLLEAFMERCNQYGLVPFEATCTDTKWMVKAIMPVVLEPVKDEVIALGITIHESAYGNGASEIAPFILRMWCTNKAQLSEELRKVHLGARLTDGIAWSDATVKSDTRTLTLQIGDLMDSQLGPDGVRKLEATYKRAIEAKIEPRQLEDFVRKNLGKDDAKAVVEAFTSADVQNMPAGQNVQRAAQAIAWFAHSVTDVEKRYEVEKLAGTMMSRALAA